MVNHQQSILMLRLQILLVEWGRRSCMWACGLELAAFLALLIFISTNCLKVINLVALPKTLMNNA